MTKEIREKLKEMLKGNYSILYSNLYNEKTNKWRYNARTLLSFMENIELAKNLEILEAEQRGIQKGREELLKDFQDHAIKNAKSEYAQASIILVRNFISSLK